MAGLRRTRIDRSQARPSADPIFVGPVAIQEIVNDRQAELLLRQNTEQVRTDQAAALELYDDGVKDSVDLSVQDLNKEIALRLGERSSKVVADIDQALLRIKEGSYGICARCSQPIDERRLEALPTARYDAACQAAIESANGDDDLPTL